MRPTPIPDTEVWADHERIVMRAPEGHDPTGDIRDVEMLQSEQNGMPTFSVRFVLEDGDIEKLQAGTPIWFTMWGHVVPFDAQIPTT